MLRSLMSRAPVSKELWQQLQPLIPPFIASRKGGRRRTISDEAAFNGILFVLRTGIPWEDLPQALGYGSGMTCWRRLRQWSETGVWEQLHQAMLVRLREHDQIDWSRASIDGSSVPSPRGARKQALTPQTGANSAPNAISLWMREAFHWLSLSVEPTDTIRCCLSRA